MLNEEDVLTAIDLVRSAFQVAPQARFTRRFLALTCQTTDRTMREAVAQLREQGHLIVADEQGGYRLATSSEDVRRYTASLRSRIVTLARRVRAMEQEAARQFGDFEQLPLELD